MHSFVAHRSETQVEAGTIGSFTTTWDGTECIATAIDGTKWRFSVKGWAGGRAWAHYPDEEQPIGAYQREKAMSYDGKLTFRGTAYGIRHSGRLHKTYLLMRGEIEMMSLRFKQGYVLGDTVEGERPWALATTRTPVDHVSGSAFPIGSVGSASRWP